MSGDDVIEWENLSDSEVVELMINTTLTMIERVFKDETSNYKTIIAVVKLYLLKDTNCEIIAKILRNSVDRHSTDTYYHNKEIDDMSSIFYINKKKVKMTTHQTAYWNHFLHATINNIMLIVLVYQSLIHSLNPKKYPHNSITLLFKIFYLTRSHISLSTLKKCILSVLEDFKCNKFLKDWELNFLLGIEREKSVIEKVIPKNSTPLKNMYDEFKKRLKNKK